VLGLEDGAPGVVLGAEVPFTIVGVPPPGAPPPAGEAPATGAVGAVVGPPGRVPPTEGRRGLPVGVTPVRIPEPPPAPPRPPPEELPFEPVEVSTHPPELELGLGPPGPR
jgi:hypothetical protein